MAVNQHEIDAQVETATQMKLRHGYSTQAVVVRSWTDESRLHLGFFFEDSLKVGDVGRHDDGGHFQVLAVI